jgi:hypothetical protein
MVEVLRAKITKQMDTAKDEKSLAKLMRVLHHQNLARLELTNLE